MTRLREAPVDAVLPHLATALDEAQMAALFQRHFDAGDARMAVRTCAIERVKYRPGRSCILAYRLTLRGRDGRSAEQRLYAGLYEAADAKDRFERARQAHMSSADGGQAPALIAPLNMLVRWFPNDRKLPSLGRLADEAAMRREHVEPLVRARFGANARIGRVSQRVVSYFPEHTCTIAVECQLGTRNVPIDARWAADAHRRAAQAWTLYGKIRYDDAGARTFAVMRELAASGAHASGAIGYAQPLAYDPALRLLWQEGICHPTLAARLDTAAATALCARVGAAIAALHDTPLADIGTRDPGDWQALLGEAAAVLTRAVPALADEVRDLHALLARDVPVPAPAEATLHGDLHANNILADDARIHLIDLDGVQRGHGLGEVCELIAELIERDCLRHGRFDPHPAQALLAGYRGARGLRIEPEECAWLVAAALLHARARRCVTSLKPGRIGALPRLLATARALRERPSLLIGAVRA